MRSLAVLLALPLALLTLSCGGGEKFVDAGLADAMSGAIPSKTDTYRLTSPEVLAVKGDFALLREGMAYQILTADGFEEIYPTLEGNPFKLLVRKWRNPYPHLRLEGYELGEERLDTKWVLGESDLPTLVEHRLYDVSLYEAVDPAAWAGKLPADIAGKKIWMPAEVEFLGTEEVVEERAPAVADTADSSAGEPAAEEVASADASPDTGVVSRAGGAENRASGPVRSSNRRPPIPAFADPRGRHRAPSPGARRREPDPPARRLRLRDQPVPFGGRGRPRGNI